MQCYSSQPVRPCGPALARVTAMRGRCSAKRAMSNISPFASPGRQIGNMMTEMQGDAGMPPPASKGFDQVMDDMVLPSFQPVLEELKKTRENMNNNKDKMDKKLDKMEQKMEEIGKDIATFKQQSFIVGVVFFVLIFVKPPSWDILAMQTSLVGMVPK